jgi:aminopeptidase N
VNLFEIQSAELPMKKVIAHEIAHSWAGNLVSCRNHEHLWINEGITSFVELKILAKTEGLDYSDMIALAGIESMKVEVSWYSIFRCQNISIHFSNFSFKNP